MIFKGENSKYGLKDENGNVLVEPIFDDIEDFSPDGYAKVKLGKKNEIIDKKGNFVFLNKKPETDQTAFDEGLKYLTAGDIKNALSKLKKADTDDALLLLYELHKILSDDEMTKFVNNRLKQRLVSRSLKEEHKRILDSISPAVYEQIRGEKNAL